LAPQVIWAYIFCTPSLDPMYLSFLNHHGEKPRPVLDAIAAMQQGLALPIASLNALRATKGLPALPADAAFSYTPHLPHGIAAVASVIHPWVPGHGWWAELHHAWRYWLKGLKLAVPVYMPVFATTTLLFGRARFMAAPLASLRHYLGSVAQASVFLSNYCTVSVRTTTADCAVRGEREGGRRCFACGRPRLPQCVVLLPSTPAPTARHAAWLPHAPPSPPCRVGSPAVAPPPHAACTIVCVCPATCRRRSGGRS
jgi:hypothetical protein